jgi:hypothetical protein
MKGRVRKRESVRLAFVGTVAVLAVSISGCRERAGSNSEQMQQMSRKTIEQVLKDKTDEWMDIPGVEGTAIGLFEGEPCIRILASGEPRQLRARIPSIVEGYAVIIEQTGTFRALDQQ